MLQFMLKCSCSFNDYDNTYDVRFLIFLTLLFLDLLVMQPYVRKGFSRAMALYYGHTTIWTHVSASIAVLIFHCLAMGMAALGDKFGLLRLTEGLLGVCVLVAAAASSRLASFTSGHEAFCWCGYLTYSGLWAYCGIMLLVSPENRPDNPAYGKNFRGQAVFDCWVITHAFLFCRIFTIALKPLNLSAKMTYSLGTFVAVWICVMLRFGWKTGSLLVAAAFPPFAILHYLGFGEFVHVNGKSSCVRRPGMCSGYATDVEDYLGGKYIIQKENISMMRLVGIKGQHERGPTLLIRAAAPECPVGGAKAGMCERVMR
jgi:hypothetical protein